MECVSFVYTCARGKTYLGLSAVATLSIPPLGSVTVEKVARATGNSDLGSADRDQRTRPLLVTECNLTGEDDLGTAGQTRKVQSRSRRDREITYGDGGAALLDRGQVGEAGESTGSAGLDITGLDIAGLEVGGGGHDGGELQDGSGDSSGETHDDC
jgi:hypothetical protein